MKTNVGHLEAASGVAGLIKAALALQHRTLPPSLHFSRPNPAIRFAETPFFVNTQCRPWTAGKLPRWAAVNSLGIGGTNAHVILEEAPECCGGLAAEGERGRRGEGETGRQGDASGVATAAVTLGRAVSPSPPLPLSPSCHHSQSPAPNLLTLSAKTPQALRELADRYVKYLSDATKPRSAIAPDTKPRSAIAPDTKPRSAIARRTARRHDLAAFWPMSLSPHRSAASIFRIGSQSSPARPKRPAARWTNGFARAGAGVRCGNGRCGRSAGRIPLSRPGCVYGGMGRELWKTAPVFREATERCEEIINELEIAGEKRKEAGETRRGGMVPADRESLISPALRLFALEYALAELWKSWGIVPAAVLGHGVGQYAAACTAGVFSLEDGLKLVAARGRLVATLPGDGRMLAVMAGPARVADRWSDWAIPNPGSRHCGHRTARGRRSSPAGPRRSSGWPPSSASSGFGPGCCRFRTPPTGRRWNRLPASSAAFVRQSHFTSRACR